MSATAENVRNLIPPEVRRQWAEQEAKEAKLAEQMRLECAEAIALIADATRHPKISRSDLEEAQKHLSKALVASALLDPEPEAA